MKFGVRRVRSPYRADSLNTVASELTKYNPKLVAIHEVKWVGGGSQSADSYTFVNGSGNTNRH